MQSFTVNTKENRKLLYDYLTKEFVRLGNNVDDAKNKAKRLIKKHNENLFGRNGLSAALGKRDFEFFCKFYLQDIFTPKDNNKQRSLAPVHYEVWEMIDRMFIKDEFDKLCLVLPRGCAKTTVCDLALTTWLHCYALSILTVVGGKKEKDAQQFIGNVRKQFEENPYIINSFGHLLDPKNLTTNSVELELTNKTDIQAISSGSSARGLNYKGTRPSVFIGDDFQDKNDVLTENAREKKWKDWNDEIEQFGDTAVIRDGVKIAPATKIISIGTILHGECLISRLLQNKNYKNMLRQAVILDDGLTIEEVLDEGIWAVCRDIVYDPKREDGKEDGRQFYLQHKEEMDSMFNVLWEEKWDKFEDIACKYWANRESFKQEMMNDASQLGTKKFKTIVTESPEMIESHTFTKTMLCIDPASTTTKKSDYSAFLVGSSTGNNIKYVRKGEILKFEFEDYINHAIELLKKYKNITHVYIEKNTYQGADVIKLKESIRKDDELRYRKLEFINEMQKRNKDEKISTIFDEVNNGVIIFNSDDVPFTTQIKEFAGCDYTLHDDAPDITAEFATRILNLSKIGTISLLDRSKLFS